MDDKTPVKEIKMENLEGVVMSVNETVKGTVGDEDQREIAYTVTQMEKMSRLSEYIQTSAVRTPDSMVDEYNRYV